MDAEFRLLGDVELRVGDRVVDLGHARQRCVLAVLLIEANRPIPAEQLLERVWADRPPRRARNALSGYLSRLRSGLAALDVAIQRAPGGYLLAVDPSMVDLHLFQDLAAQGRADADETLLERALGLWRGEAFANLDTPWINDVRARLDAERHEVRLDFTDLALARGRHGELLGELSTRASQAPQDERLAAQLMLALYRSGRQSEALLHFEVVRRGLADELGTDPTPALQTLHRAILANDAALSVPQPTRPTASGPVPRQLPPTPRHFTGRAHELEWLDAAGPIVVLSGMAGVGKTALALHWAHAAKDRFPDGQLYANLRGFGPDGRATPPAQAIRVFLDALGVSPQRVPADLDSQAGLYRSLIAGRRMLIVLDNARDADQIRPLLPGTDSCRVVVTSRDRLTGLIATAGARPLTVELLSTADAYAMLAAAAGAQRYRDEPEAIDDIITRCARLPLALSVVAARAATHPHLPLDALAKELSKPDSEVIAPPAAAATTSLDPFNGGDLHSDVRSVFSWSINALSPHAAALFRRLAAHPGPDFTAAAAASLAGLRPRRARALLDELCRAHLVMQSSPGRYHLHDLLRVYAEEQATVHDSGEQRLATLHRGLEHYLHSAFACANLLHPYREKIAIGAARPGVTPESPAGYAEALAWFTAEHDVLLCCAKAAVGTRFDGYVWRLAWTMWTYLDRQGHWRDLLAIGGAGLADAVRIGHVRGQASSHRLLSAASLRLGRFRRAQGHLRYALELYRQAGDVVGQANTHNNLAVVWEGSGRYEEALEHAQQSLALYRIAGHRRGRAQQLNAVGWYHALLGRYGEAVVHCREALAAIDELGDAVAEALTWDSLGYAYHHLGEHDEAIACYSRAIEGYADLGDRLDKAMSLKRLGDVHAECGRSGRAREIWREALSVLEDLAHPEAKAVAERLQRLARS